MSEGRGRLRRPGGPVVGSESAFSPGPGPSESAWLEELAESERALSPEPADDMPLDWRPGGPVDELAEEAVAAGEAAEEEPEEPFEDVLFGPLAVAYTVEARHWAAWRMWQQLLREREAAARLEGAVVELLDQLRAMNSDRGQPLPGWALRLAEALPEREGER